MPFIDLSGRIDIGLIISCPTGVLYSNQSDGYSCAHPTMEGAYLPLTVPVSPWASKPLGHEAIYNHWQTRYTSEPAIGYGYMKEADAVHIDAFLTTTDTPFQVTVDRTRFRDSWEGWIYTVLAPLQKNQFAVQNFEPHPRNAILVWPNSD